MQDLFFGKKLCENKIFFGGGEWWNRKWWRIIKFCGEWCGLSFFCGENLGNTGFFRRKNIKKISIFGLFFYDSCITMWLIVAQSGFLWWKNTIKVVKW